jgi:putative heme iron utilization protein
MIVDDNMNAVVAGERFDLTLDDVEEWLKPLTTGE